MEEMLEIRDRLVRVEEGQKSHSKELTVISSCLRDIATSLKAIDTYEEKHLNIKETLERVFQELRGVRTACQTDTQTIRVDVVALTERIEEIEKKEPVNSLYFDGLRTFLYLAALLASNVITALIIVYLKKG